MISKIYTKGWVKQVELSKQRVRLRIMKLLDSKVEKSTYKILYSTTP